MVHSNVHSYCLIYSSFGEVYLLCVGLYMLQLYSSTTLQLYSSTALQLYNSTSLHFYNSTALQLYNSTALQLYSSTALHLYIFTTLQLYSSTALQRYNSTFLQRYKVMGWKYYIINISHTCFIYTLSASEMRKKTVITIIIFTNCNVCIQI